LLQFKKSLPWVQPAERRGGGAEPALGLGEILEIGRGVPAAEIRTWEDVYRVEVRPGRALVKVVSSNRTEIQIDAASGEVLAVAARRSDLIESLHDVLVVEPRDGARLALEARRDLGRRRELGAHDLQRDASTEALVLREVDDAHAACAEAL
jgi:hypothetical protein